MQVHDDETVIRRADGGPAVCRKAKMIDRLIELMAAQEAPRSVPAVEPFEIDRCEHLTVCADGRHSWLCHREDMAADSRLDIPDSNRVIFPAVGHNGTAIGRHSDGADVPRMADQRPLDLRPSDV
jgi:hypothetical protein